MSGSARASLLMKKAAERSQEVGRAVTELKECIHAVVRGTTALHEELNAPSIPRAQQWHSKRSTAAVSLNNIAADLEGVFGKVLEELKVMFPEPGHAPGHEERVAAVEAALDKAGTALVTVYGKYGMNEDRVRAHWGVIRPAVHTAVVLLGDLAEQHPDLLQGIVSAAVGILAPNPLLLPPLLAIFGFGPARVIKGSTLAWAQHVFYRADVRKRKRLAKL